MSNELFTVVDGKREDAQLHAPMLKNRKADRKFQTKSRAVARSYGVSNAVLKKLYPLAN
jgi:hypothetical protein